MAFYINDNKTRLFHYGNWITLMVSGKDQSGNDDVSLKRRTILGAVSSSLVSTAFAGTALADHGRDDSEIELPDVTMVDGNQKDTMVASALDSQAVQRVAKDGLGINLSEIDREKAVAARFEATTEGADKSRVRHFVKLSVPKKIPEILKTKSFGDFSPTKEDIVDIHIGAMSDEGADFRQPPQ